MHASVDVFHTHKDGGVAADYEDAATFRPPVPDDTDVPVDDISVAVADGASESLLAGRWACLLVDEFAEADPLLDGGGFAETAARAAARWPSVYDTYIEERLDRGKPIAWYEEPGLARGAYATLLVAHFSESGTWSAAALGDSCLFQVREERLLVPFPLDTAAAFGTHPHLLNSKNVDEELVTAKALLIDGRWEQGDVFFLCTDALAAWFLLESESGRNPWATLRDLGTDAIPGPFEDWVAGERAAGRMRNDDVTFVRVHMW